MATELKDQRVPVMLSVSELRALDEWRRRQADMPSRSETVRRLLAAALEKEAVA